MTPAAGTDLDVLRLEADPLSFRFEQPLGPQPVLADLRPLGETDGAIRAEIGARLRPQDVVVTAAGEIGPSRTGLLIADETASINDIASWTETLVTGATAGIAAEDYVPMALRALVDAGRVLDEANFASTIEPDGIWLGTPGPPRSTRIVWRHGESGALPSGVQAADIPLWGAGVGAGAWSPGLGALDDVADATLTIAIAFGGFSAPEVPIAATMARLWKVVRPTGLFGMVFRYDDTQPVFQAVVDQVLDATSGRITLEHLGVLGLRNGTVAPHVSLYARRIG